MEPGGRDGDELMAVPEFYRAGAEMGEDLFTHRGAEHLAVTIERGWAQAGHAGVKCRIERALGVNGCLRIFVVRSNLVNGLPPGRQVISAGLKRQGAK